MKTFYVGSDLIKVDDEDFERTSRRTWRKENEHFYFSSRATIKSIGRFILRYTGELDVSHIDGDPTNNQKSNLKPITRRENSQFRKDNTSGFCGVNFHKRIGRWRARVMINSKDIHIGFFNSCQEAVEARKSFLERQEKYGYI